MCLSCFRFSHYFFSFPLPQFPIYLCFLYFFLVFTAAAGQQSQRGGRPAGWCRELHRDATTTCSRCRCFVFYFFVHLFSYHCQKHNPHLAGPAKNDTFMVSPRLAGFQSKLVKLRRSQHLHKCVVTCDIKTTLFHHYWWKLTRKIHLFYFF